MTRRFFAEASPQRTGGEKDHRRKVMAAQLCSVVAPAAMKLGYVHMTEEVHWYGDWASLVSGLELARYPEIEWE